MRSLLILLALGSSVAAADPTTNPTPTRSKDPRWIRSETIWRDAADDPRTEASASKWLAAADGFEAVARDPAVALVVRRECAFASLLAVRELIRVSPAVSVRPRDVLDDSGAGARPGPRPLDVSNQRLVDAATLFLTLAPDEHGPRNAVARFLRLGALRRFDHLDAALVDLVEILEHERTHEVWLYAANLVLDVLIRLERYDDLIIWVRRLRADELLATSEPELAARLQLIEQTWSRKQAERLEQAGDHVACGEAYDRARAIDPAGGHADQMVFNAGLCFERGAATARALARYAELMRTRPRSSVVAAARVRSAYLRLARFDLAGAARDAGPQLGSLGVVVRPLAAALVPGELLFRR